MRTIIMKWGFIPAWLLVLLYPWPSGADTRPTLAVCLAAMWAVQATREWNAGQVTMVPCRMSYEN